MLREEGRLRVMRKIFRPKREEVTEEGRKLHKEGLNDLYSSPNIIRVIKPRRMRWVGHVARTGAIRCLQDLVGKSNGKKHLEDQVVDGRIVS
jgi:hypothetical protein